jgi:hypothetical protein
VLINPIKYFIPLFFIIRTYKYFQSKDLNIKKNWKFPLKKNLFIIEENCVFWSDLIELFTRFEKTSICEIANIYFQKEGIIKFFCKFSKTRYFTWCSQKLVSKKKWYDLPNRKNVSFSWTSYFSNTPRVQTLTTNFS